MKEHIKSVRYLSILNEYICLYIIKGLRILGRQQSGTEWYAEDKSNFYIRAIIEHLRERENLIHEQNVALMYTQEC